MGIKITRRTNTDRQKFFNGTIKESFNALVTSDGSIVTLNLEKDGGGDLTLQFSDGLTLFDTTPAATITLTAGSDASPTENFIFILQSDKILTKSTSDWPTTEHTRIGYYLVPSAGFVQSNGVYINQHWNEELVDSTNNMGDLAHISEKLRILNASYFSGVDGNGTDNYLTPTAGNVELKSTSGIVYQKHRQTFAAVDTSTGDVVLVKNWSGDSFHDLTNLYDIVADSTGTTIGNNKYFNLIIWGAVNKSGEYSPTIINLPSGFYNTQSGAESDASSFDDFTIPREFNRESSTGFLIARVTIQMKTSGGTWVVSSTTDLRGQIPTTATGGVSSIVTQFADNTFIIFDETDNTKELIFDVGTNVPTGTTRTLKIPNLNGTIFLAEANQNITGGGSGHDQFSDFVANEHLDHALSLDADLIMWLRMDDITGSTVSDFTTNGNDGTLQSGAVQADGLIGKSVLLDGVNDHILVGNSASLDENFTAFGISIWVKPNFTQINANHERVIDKDNDVGLAFRMFYVGSFKNWRFQITTDVGTKNCDTAGLTWGANTWHHIVATYDGTNMRFYWDGEIITTEPHTGTIVNGAGDLFIGIEKTLGSAFGGEVDDVMIFKRNVSANEAKEIHQLGIINAGTNFTKAYYKEYIASRSAFFNHAAISKDLDVGVDLKVGRNTNIGGILTVGGNTTIIGRLNVTDRVTFDGDLTADNGTVIFDVLTFDSSDPKVIGWNPTTRDYVKSWAEKIMAYSDGVGRFFNKDTRCFEIFEPSTGKFYKDSCLKDLEVVEQVTPIINEDIEPYYKWDKVLGEPVLRFKPLMNNLLKLPENQMLNRETGELEEIPEPIINLENEK